jgi:hypothetical protein
VAYLAIEQKGLLMDLKEQRLWMGQWRDAATALRQQKEMDLRNLSDAEARCATESLLSLAGKIRYDPKRWQTSGLVEQQRWFQKMMIT